MYIIDESKCSSCDAEISTPFEGLYFVDENIDCNCCEIYNGCDCGGVECGCNDCFSCNACENCLE